MVVTPRKQKSKDKIVPTPKALASIIAGLRASGKTVAVTNGVFDLLHVGHVRYLEDAKSRADFLVVAVNSDRSASAIKNEPVVPADERAEMLSSLWMVDYVVEFDEDSADDLLRTLQPDVYAKGTDYNSRTLPERHTVKELGIKSIFVGDKKAHSTSKLIEKIKKL